ncbi:uncharacterized protein LOC130667198 [Microplitis mediator]|uniref:uncharacterized protein LOC130667198 n=1 Tax=Microplitis mediator TaxID=375433 RepID=UPI0025564D6F|nr:uncharacterized protein LOC130667198 [Microplitis mediator]
MDLQLNELIAKFWEQEEPKTTESTRYSDDDLLCEEHFKTTHTRSADGRYIVRLPIEDLDTPLGDSVRSAQYSLRRILKRLDADKSLSELCHSFMMEYKQLGHMKEIPLKDLPQNSYFLPHHGVLREQSTTAKLRVVFNGSCSTSTGISLNDMLHVGPKVQIDICDVLLRIRSHAALFGTDITKMFRQMNVEPQDWPL